jgi:hypothetical protein
MFKKLVSNVYFWLALAVTFLLVLLGNEKARRKLLELKLIKAVSDAKDVVIEEKISQIKSELEKEKQLQKDLKQELDKKKEVALTNKEIEDFWKKN